MQRDPAVTMLARTEARRLQRPAGQEGASAKRDTWLEALSLESLPYDADVGPLSSCLSRFRSCPEHGIDPSHMGGIILAPPQVSSSGMTLRTGRGGEI